MIVLNNNQATLNPCRAPREWGGYNVDNQNNRDHRIDTIKGYLIILVVFGHLLEPFLTERVNIIVYNLIYSFHMPLFVIISGYFFNSNQKIDRLKSSSIKLAETFILYFIIYQAIKWGESGRLTYNDAISPPYIMWYLWALIIWRFMGYFTFNICNYKHPSIFIALGIALIIGILPLKNELAIQRIFSFGFFFIIGINMRTNHIKLSQTLLIALIPVLFISCYLLIKLEGRNVDELRWFFYYNRPYETLYDTLIRFLALMLGLAISLAIWNKIKSQHIISQIGAATLPIYLLHLLPIKCYTYYAKTLHLPQGIITLLLISLCIVYCIYLVSKIKHFEFVLNPISYSLKSIKNYKLGVEA